MNTNNLFIEFESKYDFNTTVEKLNNNIVDNNWKVPAIHDLQETLRKSNYNVLPVKIIELCNPKYSSKLLSSDDCRIVSSLMPCRISVYEKENGKTYVSQINASMLSSEIGGTIENVMNDAIADINILLKSVL